MSDSLGILSEGGGELADSLAEGAANIPSYNTAEREHLSAVAAAPVEVVTERAHEVPTYGYGLAPYFASLALWVGAIALYLMRPALNSTLLAWLAVGILGTFLAVGIRRHKQSTLPDLVPMY